MKKSVHDNCIITTSWLNVRLAHHEINDARVDYVCAHLREILKESLGNATPRGGNAATNTAATADPPLWANVDFSGNPLTGVGVKKLLSLFREFNVALKCLKLYKCQMEDDGGIDLAQFLERQAEPFEELHLSHNRLTHVTMIALLAAVKKNARYPHPPRGAQGANGYNSTLIGTAEQQGTIPLWARLEYNQIPKVDHILALVKQAYALNVCHATDREHCGPWRCCNARTGVNVNAATMNASESPSNPCVHLFSISQQRTTTAQESGLDKASVKRLITKFAPKACAQSVALMNNPASTGTAKQLTRCTPGSGGAQPAGQAVPKGNMNASSLGAPLSSTTEGGTMKSAYEVSAWNRDIPAAILLASSVAAPAPTSAAPPQHNVQDVSGSQSDPHLSFVFGEPSSVANADSTTSTLPAHMNTGIPNGNADSTTSTLPACVGMSNSCAQDGTSVTTGTGGSVAMASYINGGLDVEFKDNNNRALHSNSQAPCATSFSHENKDVDTFYSSSHTTVMWGDDNPSMPKPYVQQQGQRHSGASSKEESTKSMNAADGASVHSYGHNFAQLEHVDTNAIHYVFDPVTSELIFKCLACTRFFKQGQNQVVVSANCWHTFCNDCFAEMVKNNVKKEVNNDATILRQKGGKQIPCAYCQVMMMRSEALLLQSEDWEFMKQKLEEGELHQISSSDDSEKDILKNDRVVVYPEQVNESTSDALRSETFVCMFCKTVSLQPLLTSCSHVFCSCCFENYVSGQVAAKKARGEQVIAVPCPYPHCKKPLRKAEVFDLRDNDAARSGTCAAVTAVIQRVRNNMKVRCTHHHMHYSFDFGARAHEVKQLYNVSCDWEGDLNNIEKHLQVCPVVKMLGNEELQPEPEEEDEPPSPSFKVDKNNIRKVMYEFKADGAGQLSLKIGDIVELLETSGSGWAAGRLVTCDGQVVGDEAGWFPATFLASV